MIEALGDKLQAKAMARAAGVPLAPGSDRIADAGEARRFANDIGYPVLLKASAGGGGRGMVIARDRRRSGGWFRQGQRRGPGRLQRRNVVHGAVRRRSARHVEVQLMGDGHGKVLHFGERDCSVQRRYQKLVEEAPCAVDASRTASGKLHVSRRLSRGKSVNYRSAGTAEFLYDVERQEPSTSSR